MAERPVFVPSDEECELVKTDIVEFDWFPGQSKAQRQLSVGSFHRSIRTELEIDRVLEISTKSESSLGRSLSAFNLEYKGLNRSYSLESLFQSSKKFELGGPYKDIKLMRALDAKKDSRLTTSGRLVCFQSNGVSWPLEPYTLFYDWLYLNVVFQNGCFDDGLMRYQAFTDIEFNPKRSINCQAYSAALYVSLARREMLETVLSSPDEFINYITSFSKGRTTTSSNITRDLF